MYSLHDNYGLFLSFNYGIPELNSCHGTNMPFFSVCFPQPDAIAVHYQSIEFHTFMPQITKGRKQLLAKSLFHIYIQHISPLKLRLSG